MDYIFLGRSGLSVSRLSFGAATFGGADAADLAVGRIGVVELPGAQRLVGLCRDAGVNYFDTADVYSAGDSETILGKALGATRQQIVLGTKTTMPMGPGQHDLGASRQHIVRACEDSLRRLGTDWIDLYQIHYPDYLTPVEETLRALDDLVRSGKVRYIGCSNYSAWHMMRSTAASDARHLERFVSHQISYSLLDRDTELEVVPAAIDQGVGLMAWGPLSGGFLTGKYHRNQPMPKGSRFEELPNYPGPSDLDKAHDVVDAMRAIAEARDRPVAEVGINWVLRKPWISSVVLGARTEDQLKSNLKATEWALSEAEVATLDAVSAPRVPYPYWVQQKINAARTPALPFYHA